MLVLATQAGGDARRIAVLAATLAGIYLLSWPILAASERLVARLGEGKVGNITRVLGIVLAALAVQCVFDGIPGFLDSRETG